MWKPFEDLATSWVLKVPSAIGKRFNISPEFLISNFYDYNERACTRGEAEKNLATSAFFFSRSAAFLRWRGARGRREGAAGDGVFSAELQIGHNRYTVQGCHGLLNLKIRGTVPYK
jgi:hypothetical protein